MPTLGRYCKAYPLSLLREFDGWREKSTKGAPESRHLGDAQTEAGEDQTKPAHLYLQETYHVTEGIFLDASVVFDDITPEWVDFCRRTLKFEVPAN